MTGGVGIEKTAEWCLNTANKYIKETTNGRCWVEKVEVWEHDKNSALAFASNKCCSNRDTATQTHTTVAAPAPEIQEAINNVVTQGNNPNAAPVGNKVTTGFSNLFAGTSWGA